MPILSFDAIRDKVNGARRARRFAAGRKRLMKEHGYAILPLREEPPGFRDERDRIALWQSQDCLERFEPLYAAAAREDAMLCNGLKLYLFQWNTLFDDFGDDGDDCDRRCAPFAAWWERTHSPLSAAAYAKALHHTAFAYRGGGTVDETSETQWAGFNARLEQGREILAASAEHAGDLLPWHWPHYDLAQHQGGSFEEFHASFMRAWSLDTSNWTLCRSHGVRLLPRWYGEDARDLEHFARHAASLTQDRFGAGMYALIYERGYHIGAHEIGDTVCDIELFKRGFEDLVERYPCQSLYNRWASGLYFAEQYRSCERVFKTRIKAIVPEIWSGDDRDEQIKDALDTFYVVTD